ncbi:hypothetical protein ABH966_003507, partial [Lysinibacillus sp. RC46]
REGCYKEGAKSKTYSVTIKSDTHAEQEAFQNTKAFKQLAANRYKVEAKNSEIKTIEKEQPRMEAALFSV